VNAVADVLEAAEERATALASGDADRLAELLHEDFRWISHRGETFDRKTYVDANTRGRTTWRHQDLGEPDVLVLGEVAVLWTVVTDTVETSAGPETFRMPMTQTWVRGTHGWRCLAGHAGPLLNG
jgi:ketosteroid isomerase-like protein